MNGPQQQFDEEKDCEEFDAIISTTDFDMWLLFSVFDIFLSELLLIQLYFAKVYNYFGWIAAHC